MKKTFVFALILICLIALGMVCILPVKAQYQGNITINADGSITPSTVPIQQTGNVYTLTSNITGSITENRNNAILDGDGYTLSGGLSLDSVSNITVENFVIVDGAEIQIGVVGISLSDTSNVIVANNTITEVWSILILNADFYVGIDVDGGGSNVISGNCLVNNGVGMSFSDTAYNLIVGNNITCGTNAFGIHTVPGGIGFDDASNNTIYHNNIQISYGGLAGESDSVNVWDDGYPAGGNYWSNYQTIYPNAAEVDSSGIGNTSYVIDSQNKDWYPLMEPFTESFLLNYEQEVTPPTVTVLSPLNQTCSESNVSLAFSIDKAVNWIGYSLDNEQNVTITGNTTIANITNGFHTLTVYANDTFGDMGTSQTFNFTIALPEAKPFPATTIIAALGTIVVVGAAAGLLVYFKKYKR